MHRVVVIGGGAAGLIAAGTAAQMGKEVFLIEKNNILGKKLLITGKGRCNVTNDCDIDTLMANTPTNGRFLFSAFNALDCAELMRLLKDNGAELKTERGGRVFPISDKSADIVNALKRYINSSCVKVITNEVIDITVNEQGVDAVKLKDGTVIKAQSVIIASGGVSYPLTGSTGDGYKLASRLGHTVIKARPSLVPLETQQSWVKDLQGLALKNIRISVNEENKKNLYSDFGELLFTHFGLSGPVILSASAHMRNIENKKYNIEIDLKPALSTEQLNNRILRDFEALKNKDFANSLDKLLPKRLIPIVISLCGIEPHIKINQITAKQRLALCQTLKCIRLDIKGFRPIAEAIITSGGISTKEINPSTMESKLVNGLYFAGEVIDVDAYTGGFNLQIAFSTGYLAGKMC